MYIYQMCVYIYIYMYTCNIQNSTIYKCGRHKLEHWLKDIEMFPRNKDGKCLTMAQQCGTADDF